MTDINITYETLYELLRNEKNRDDLQELSPEFYNDVIIYINKNKDMLDEAISKDATDEEKEARIRQLKNIKNILKEIYERREKKILNLALSKSRTKSESMEVDILLPLEKELYEQFTKTLNLFRNELLIKTLNGSTPYQNIIAPSNNSYNQNNNNYNNSSSTNSSNNKDSNSSNNKNSDGSKDENINSNNENNRSSINNNIANNINNKNTNENRNNMNENRNNMNDNINNNDSINKNNQESLKNDEKFNNNDNSNDIKDSNKSDLNSKVQIRFKENVPKFLGKELEVYGPYETNDVIVLPRELAQILINKDKAEELS
jgi:DNA replication initiation complex subunit (GINS family)